MMDSEIERDVHLLAPLRECETPPLAVEIDQVVAAGRSRRWWSGSRRWSGPGARSGRDGGPGGPAAGYPHLPAVVVTAPRRPFPFPEAPTVSGVNASGVMAGNVMVKSGSYAWMYRDGAVHRLTGPAGGVSVTGTSTDGRTFVGITWSGDASTMQRTPVVWRC